MTPKASDTDFNDETDLYGTGEFEQTKTDKHRYRRFPRFSKKWAKYGIPYNWRPYHQISVLPLYKPTEYDPYLPDEPQTFYRSDYFLEEEFFTFDELKRSNVFYDSNRLITGDGPNVSEHFGMMEDLERETPQNFNQVLLDWHFMFRENKQLTNRDFLLNDQYSSKFWWYKNQFPRAFDDFPRMIFQFHRRFRRFWSIRFRKIKFDNRTNLYNQRKVWFRSLHLEKQSKNLKQLSLKFRRLGWLSRSCRNKFYFRHQAHLAREGYSDQEKWFPRTKSFGYDYYKKHFSKTRPPKPLNKWVRQLKSMGRDRSTPRRIFPRRHFPKYSPVYSTNRLFFEQLTGNSTFGFRRLTFSRDDFYPAIGFFSVFGIGLSIWIFQLITNFTGDFYSWETLFFDRSITDYLGNRSC